jgi:hypothetical protein
MILPALVHFNFARNCLLWGLQLDFSRAEGRSIAAAVARLPEFIERLKS